LSSAWLLIWLIPLPEACWVIWNQAREDGGVEFINEGRGARLRIFAALKHRFLKQVR